MAQGYTSLPQEERQDGGSEQKSLSFLDRTKRWWKEKVASDTERAPLLDRQRMTIEPPKKNTRKVILTALLVIIALLVAGAGTAFMLEHDNVDGKEDSPVDSDIQKLIH